MGSSGAIQVVIASEDNDTLKPVRETIIHITPNDREASGSPAMCLGTTGTDIQTSETIVVDDDCETASVVRRSGSFEDFAGLATVGLLFSSEDKSATQLPTLARFLLDDTDSVKAQVPQYIPRHRFDRWLKTLQRKTRRRHGTDRRQETNSPRAQEAHVHADKEQVHRGHRKSLSESSFDFVTRVKTASISMASASVAPFSRRTGLSSRYQRTDRSSRASNAGARQSEDNTIVNKLSSLDEAVNERSLQRRRILEELISTEEAYIADIRFLQNVYTTLLASIPTMSLTLRTSTNRTLNEMLELHEGLLERLHQIIPHSDQRHRNAHEPRIVAGQRHRRFKSLDEVYANRIEAPSYRKPSGTFLEANIGAKVAEVFGRQMHRFFVYEEYGAKYESLVRDIASTHRTLPQWDAYQKGLEALAASLMSVNNRMENRHKSITVGDLLVKPIQRVCRYPLMFAELLKQTPVCDCPDSHMQIENVLIRLRETTWEINEAKADDPRRRVTLEKTWVLQDRLAMPEQHGVGLSKGTLRALGHIHLCGVLYVAWQTRTAIEGQYMIALLYRDHLVLAVGGKSEHAYMVKAVVGLTDANIEEVDNGRGLQCHTAPFSWKLIFEYDHQLHEMILSACSPKEELEWRSRLADRVTREHSTVSDPPSLATLCPDMKPLGAVFGKPGTVARRISIHRAMTVGPKSSMCQVIIKNTTTLKDAQHSASSMVTQPINRSQSLLSTNRITVLAPPRSDRTRLESLVSDVWSREILPFPGMTTRVRSEHIVRASASSVIRKLSAASIASNFTRRSTSMVSFGSSHRVVTDERHDADGPTYSQANSYESTTPTAPCTPTKNDVYSPRLSVIQDSNSPYEGRASPMNDEAFYSTPASTLIRLATRRGPKGGQSEPSRIATPPLKTASANSLLSFPTPPAQESPFEGSENQTATKHGIWTKAAGINRGPSMEGIRGFFR